MSEKCSEIAVTSWRLLYMGRLYLLQPTSGRPLRNFRRHHQGRCSYSQRRAILWIPRSSVQVGFFCSCCLGLLDDCVDQLVDLMEFRVIFSVNAGYNRHILLQCREEAFLYLVKGWLIGHMDSCFLKFDGFIIVWIHKNRFDLNQK